MLPDGHQITSVENPAVENGALKDAEDHYYDEWDQLSEPPDAGEIDRRDSDSSDYEDSYSKRRKKKKTATRAKVMVV